MLALRSAGRPVSDLNNARRLSSDASISHVLSRNVEFKYPQGWEAGYEDARSVYGESLSPAETHAEYGRRREVTLEDVQVAFRDQTVRELVLQNILPAEETEEALDAASKVKSDFEALDSAAEQAAEAEAEQDGLRVADDRWLGISIRDPAVRFEVRCPGRPFPSTPYIHIQPANPTPQITKRLTSLTGLIPSDFNVTHSPRLSTLLHNICKPRDAPQPKLAERLSVSAAIAALPNVTVKDRRITPIDVEKDKGRWKLIEQALTERGLPVTGQTTWVKPNVERGGKSLMTRRKARPEGKRPSWTR